MERNAEYAALLRLLRLEELAGRKASIYAKLLTDQSLADKCQAAADRHQKRCEALQAFAARYGAEGGEQ